MFHKLFNGLVALVIMAGLNGLTPPSPARTDPKPVAIGALPVQGIQLVAPRDDKVLRDLEIAGRISERFNPRTDPDGSR